MPSTPRALRLTFELLGLGGQGNDQHPSAELEVSRTVEVPATMRMIQLHELIQSVFGWTDQASHVFADRSRFIEREHHDFDTWSNVATDEFAPDVFAPDAFASDAFVSRTRPYRWGPRRRVWEMEHWCRDRDSDHVSECEWTATVGSAMDSLDTLYYEYGVGESCPAPALSGAMFAEAPWQAIDEESSGLVGPWLADDEPWSATTLSPCAAFHPDLSTDAHAHGWVIAITAHGSVPARHTNLVDGIGRTPIEACGGASAYRVLVDAITDPAHAMHVGLVAWAREKVGPWAASGDRAFDPMAFSLPAVQARIPSPLEYGWRSTGARPRVIDHVFNGRSLNGRSQFPKEAIEGLVTAAHEATDPANLPDSALASSMTERLRSSLERLPSSRTKPLPTTPADIDPAHDRTLAAIKVAYRRGGVLLRSRAGDDALADPIELLGKCAARYWSLKGDGEVQFYVALAAAEGLSGAALVERVTVAARRRIDDSEREIAECLRNLETCGGTSEELVTGEALRAFASLVLRS